MSKLKPFPKERKVRGTTATYRMPDRKNDVCDLDELAEQYCSVGNVPERLGWQKACEISLLARAYLCLKAECGKKVPTVGSSEMEASIKAGPTVT